MSFERPVAARNSLRFRFRGDAIADVGASINPAIDIVQIEGAFIQGVGC